MNGLLSQHHVCLHWVQNCLIRKKEPEIDFVIFTEELAQKWQVKKSIIRADSKTKQVACEIEIVVVAGFGEDWDLKGYTCRYLVELNRKYSTYEDVLPGEIVQCDVSV